jgi:hypothetical protein
MDTNHRNDPFEQERLKVIATDVLRVLKDDELKDAKAVAEVAHLLLSLRRTTSVPTQGTILRNQSI